MYKLIAGAVLLVLISIASFFFTLTYVSLKLETKADAALSSVTKEVAAVDITRKSLDDLMVQTTVLIVDADNTESKESKMLDGWNAKLTTTLDKVNDGVVALTANQNTVTSHTVQTIDAATDSLKELKGTVVASKGLLVSAQSSVDDVHRELPAILGNLNKATDQAVSLEKQSTDTMQHLSGTTDDVQKAVHSYLHPRWPQKLRSLIVGAGSTVAKFFL